MLGNKITMVTLVVCTLMFSSGVIWASEQKAQDAKIDPGSGLIMAPGWELVRGNCTACHSSKTITFQRGTRDTWTSIIRWMQKTQGLWEFEAKTEDTILTYLATNYPPEKSTRRRNLAPQHLPLMPLK